VGTARENPTGKNRGTEWGKEEGHKHRGMGNCAFIKAGGGKATQYSGQKRSKKKKSTDTEERKGKRQN